MGSFWAPLLGVVGAIGESGEENMTLELDPSRDLGLQHVLRSSAAFLRGSRTDNDERDRLLSNLAELFVDAQKGSSISNLHGLSVSRSERYQLNRFGVFVKYLSSYREDVSELIAETSDILSQVKSGQASKSDKEKVAKLIDYFAEELRKDRALEPLAPPRVLAFG